LESPKLTALLQAYLRGLIKPDYQQGIRSIIREELVLHAVMCEELSNNLINTINLASSIIPMAKEPGNLIEELQDKLKLSKGLRSYITDNKPTRETFKDAESSAKLFLALEEAGLFDSLSKNNE